MSRSRVISAIKVLVFVAALGPLAWLVFKALQDHLGANVGTKAWDDTMLFGDPEAPTTTTRRFDYGVFTGGAKVAAK